MAAKNIVPFQLSAIGLNRIFRRAERRVACLARPEPDLPALSWI